MRFFYFLAMLGILGYWITYMKFKNYIPILMYHRIADNPGDRNSLSVTKFEEQLAYLAEQGYKTITPEEFLTHYNRQGDLPKKSVMLTFDDAYMDTYEVALPLLEKYKMKAVVCPISNWLDSTNEWEDKGKALTTTMGAKELKDWVKRGMSIAAHTVDHPMLTACSDKQLDYELLKSKEDLTTVIGEEVKYICYPYGNVNKKVSQRAKELGYELGFAIFESAPLWTIDLWRLPRVPIAGHQTLKEFKTKIGKNHVFLLLLRKLERSFKRLFR